MFLLLFYFILFGVFKKCEFVLSLMNVWVVVFICVCMCDRKWASDMDTDMVLVMVVLDIGSIRLIWT